MKRLDIEQLLQWTYLDELCKGGDGPSNNQWDLVMLLGARAERPESRLPAYFGGPHPDAIAIHHAVQQLPAPAPALILKHATLQTRPDWLPGPIRVLPTYGPHRKLPQVVGECRGKNKYTLGSYCPLRWVPSAAEINAARLEWQCWWGALFVLSASLRLSEHVVTGPAALVSPWLAGPLKISRVLQSQRAR
jgi:hypothetical protein